MEKIGHREVVEFAGYLLNEETLIMNYITMAIVILIAILASRNLKEVPTGWQNAIEAVAEVWEEKINTMIGPTGRSLTHIFLTLFVYLVIANWLGLFPAMESPTNDLNTTLGLAITMSMLIHHGIGVARNGIGYFKHFLEPFAPFIVIHIIEELARPASLAFRLFGNILAGEVLIIIILNLAPWYANWAPHVVWVIFSLAVGVIQAYIFTTLSLVYIAPSAKPHEHEEHE